MPYYFIPLLILSFITACIEVDISVPGFPEMAQYFQVSESTIQMTIAYNFLGFCIGALAYGPLSDSYGRRPIMLWGNAILMIGAIGCVLAPDIPTLLFARFIQGIGAATSVVVAFAMIADAYPDPNKSSALIGSMNAVITGLMALAPIVGGFINQAVGWRGNYGIVAAITVLAWISLVFYLPETLSKRQPLILPKIGKDYLQLLKSPTFMKASLVPSLLYGIYLSFIAQASFLYILSFKVSLIEYVFHQAVILVAFSLMSLMSGKVIHKLGSNRSLHLGMGISLTGALLLMGMAMTSPYSPYLMTTFMSLVCLGSAIVYPIIFAASLEIFPLIKGTASSKIMSFRSVICFICIALTGYFYSENPFNISVMIFLSVILSILLTKSLIKTLSLSRSSC